ncbi:hypothetical protein BU15DRAFT_72510 [Melanogaster broomeanus]|nr:hypothetical protein BU15DRAFT_72510 [Melanogaster broomeanus]
MRTTSTYGAVMRRVASTPAPGPSSSNSIETSKDGWRMARARVMEFMEANSGMLLLLLSQLFSSLTYFSVKVLNQLDIPIPALEIITVRMSQDGTVCALDARGGKHPISFMTIMRTTSTYGAVMRRVASTPAPGPSSSNSIETSKDGWRMARARVMEFMEANSGMLLLLLSQLFSSLTYFSVKVLNQLDIPIPALEIITVRMIITYIFCMLYTWVYSTSIIGLTYDDLGLVFVYSLCAEASLGGFFGLFGPYYALQYLSLADATVLTFLSPPGYGSCGIPDHEGKLFYKTGSGQPLSGVVLIARPPFLFGNSLSGSEGSADSPANATPEERLGAVAIALVGVFGITGAYISMRAVGKRAHPMHSITYFSLWCIVVSSTSMVVLKVPVVYPTNWQWTAMLLMVGVFGLSFQVGSLTNPSNSLRELVTLSDALDHGGSNVVFAVILERVFFGTVPSLFSIIGAAIIIASAIYVVLSKQAQSNVTTNVSLDSGDAALEEGLLENRHSDSSDGAHETDDDMGSAVEPLVSPHDPEIRAGGLRN